MTVGACQEQPFCRNPGPNRLLPISAEFAKSVLLIVWFFATKRYEQSRSFASVLAKDRKIAPILQFETE